MRQFLVPFNVKFYDANKAYKELEEIDWSIRAKMKIGDEVYFYCSKPIGRILLKGVVTDIDIDIESMIEDRKFYANKSKRKFNGVNKYTRIKKLQELPLEVTEALTFEKLRENGLKGNIQSAFMIDKNKELYSYINKII